MRSIPETFGLDVSRETISNLEYFSDETARWSRKINLVSRSDAKTIWERHVLDSLQIWKLINEKTRTWIDLGSGGGFPALVLAILAKEQSKNTAFRLVESDKRKCAFLRHMSNRLSLSATVSSNRIEDEPGHPYDIVSARALADLSRLVDYATVFAGPATRMIFPKGNRWKEEVESARKKWQFEMRSFQSLTDEKSAVLELSNVKRV
jgi:16S rRNA (guanine527-N7)-methyltransferase